MPEIIAHRGTPRDRRENTLAGFRTALEQRADAFELDVHATRDGVVVVHHDPTLGAGVEPAALAGTAIANMDAAILATVRLQPGPDGRREPVPTLREVLDLAAGRATAYVEIKGKGIEPLVLAELADAFDVAVHGFDHRVSRRVAAAEGAPPTGILVYSYLLDPVHALREAGARDYWCWWEFIDQSLVDRVQAAGGRVVAWTVNDPAAARDLAALGVDGLCTDVPGVIRDAVGS